MNIPGSSTKFTNRLKEAGRIFFALCIAGLGIYQMLYGNLRAVLDPSWPVYIPGRKIWVYLLGAVLLIGGLCLLFNKKIKPAAVILALLFLLIVLGWHLPYMLFIHPYNHHIAVWADLNKILAFSGGSFIVAGMFFPSSMINYYPAAQIKSSRRLVALGAIFFSLMLITFGIDHLKYAKFISPMVPSWIGSNIFWTYFTGIALIGGGIAVLFLKKLKIFIFLTGIMILIWLIVIHIPRAIADPYVMAGNEIASALQALGFSGIAFMLAGSATESNKEVIE